MRKNAIKGILFSIASATGFSALAGELPQGLHLVEELPIEQRVIVHQQVLKFLNEHPENAADAKVIAVDEKGTVYVLDDKMEKMARVGQPSCVGGL
ncbi:MAG: hypothetical protein AB7K68_06320 [Bacteriovoracia bacterium]